MRRIRKIFNRQKKKQEFEKIGTNQNSAISFSVGVFSARRVTARAPLDKFSLFATIFFRAEL
jgi:hypothetical protein